MKIRNYIDMLCGIFISIILVCNANAQLSGDYTIGLGGSYSSFDDAVADLMNQGISGTVTLGIKSGEYEVSASSALLIDINDNIPGVSDSNRVIFQPDYRSGADIDNVILKKTGGTTTSGDPLLISIKSDFVTLKNLTIKMEDSTVTSTYGTLIDIEHATSASAITGVEVLGCKLFGDYGALKVDYGIRCNSTNYRLKISENDISGAKSAIRIQGKSYDGIINQNYISDGGLYQTNSGAEGIGIYVYESENLTMQSNTIDYFGGAKGSVGIGLRNTKNFLLDGNLIKNISSGNGGDYDNYYGININNAYFSEESGIVSNNMVAGVVTARRRGISINSDNLTICYNTVVMPSRGIATWQVSGALFLSGSNNDLLNNILVDLSSSGNRVSALNLSDPLENNSNYNDLYCTSDYTVISGNSYYETLTDWHNDGYGIHSVSKLPEFASKYTDPHLTNCSIADGELFGISVPEVTWDFDGETRSDLNPFMGADEEPGELPQIFSSPVTYQAGQGSWLFTAGDYNGDGTTDLAVTNTPYAGGSNDLTIMWNQDNSQFASPEHFSAGGTNLNEIKSAELNDDNLEDLVISSDDSLYVLYSHDQGGNYFPEPYAIPPMHLESGGTIIEGEIQTFAIGDVDIDGANDIVLINYLHQFSPFAKLSAFLNNGSSFAGSPASIDVPPSVDQMKIANLNDDLYPDAILVNSNETKIYIAINQGNDISGDWLGFGLPTVLDSSAVTLPTSNTLLVNDFDGDGDMDIIVKSSISNHNLGFFKNDGTGNFVKDLFTVSLNDNILALTAMDYEGDGDMDIMVATSGKNVNALLNQGAETGRYSFELAVLCDDTFLGSTPQAMLAANFDQDLNPDVAVLGVQDSVSILTNLHWNPTGTEEDQSIEIPDKYALMQNYPNPFNPVTTIEYSIPTLSHVVLKIYDALGREVATLVNKNTPAGTYHVAFDGRFLSSGMYFYRIQAGDYTQVKKMLLLK